jgi:hypothetical protein
MESKFDDSKSARVILFFIFFFFGGIIALFDFISPKILNCFEYIAIELRFQHRLYFTKYFDKIYLDDLYSEDYDSREKKLKRTGELAQNGSKQMQRHNRLIQKRYGIF